MTSWNVPNSNSLESPAPHGIPQIEAADDEAQHKHIKVLNALSSFVYNLSGTHISVTAHVGFCEVCPW